MSLRSGGREVARGAAIGQTVALGPVVLTDRERTDLEVRLSPEDFPRYARSHRPALVTPVTPDHHLELTA